MSWLFKILGGSNAAGQANVDANFNLNVNLPVVQSQAGYAAMLIENDAGALTGTRYTEGLKASIERRLQVGLDTMLFHHMFSSNAQNTGVWKHLFTTMTAVQSGGALILNNNLTLGAATGCSMQSWRYFSLMDLTALVVTITLSQDSAMQGGQVYEHGLFVPTATAAPTEGVYIRYTSAGIIGVINFNGTETTTGVLPVTVATNTTFDLQMIISEREVEFWYEGQLLGEINVPPGNPNIFLSESLPLGIQMRNSGIVSGTAARIKVGCVSVFEQDVISSKFWQHTVSGNGNAYQGMDGGTMGSLALYTNSLAAGAGVALTNTTAAAGSGLGGQFAVQPTLAVGTDGILMSFQNPVGSITQPARVLHITGITIAGAVTTALTGGAVVWAMAACWGHTAVSLATTEAASFANNTTKAPRRMPLGVQAYAATAAVGVIGAPIQVRFDVPLVVNPGEFFAISAKNLGVVTTAGVITELVTVDHYFE